MRAGVAALALAAAACAPAGDDVRDEASAAKGRAERVFWASYDQARTALAAGDVASARAKFLEALASKPDHPASLYALAGIEHRAGRPEEALKLCERLLESDRPRTRGFLLRATIESDVEAVLAGGGVAGGAAGPWFDLDRADADAAAAEAENPEETGPHLLRAKVALLRNDLATAASSLSRTLTIHPGHAEAHVLRAVLARRRGDAEGEKEAIAKALAATEPKEQTLPPGEGDTEASLAAAAKLGTPRLRALAAALVADITPWPRAAPLRPTLVDLPEDLPAPGPEPLRCVADFDGDGVPDELRARRASEAHALPALFGVHDGAHGSFTLRLGDRDATAASGLDGVAACAGALVAGDVDGDRRIDVIVLPGAGDPSRVEPPLVLRNVGGGRFSVEIARPR